MASSPAKVGRRSWVAWALWGSTLVALAATMVLAGLNRPILRGGISSSYLVVAVITSVYASAGALIAIRVRGNPIGWILMGMGAALALGALSEQYVLRALIAEPGSLPGAGAMAWVGNSVLLLIVLPVPIVFLLFPTGRAASRRWSWVLRASVGAALLGVVGTIVYPGEEDGITNSLKEHGLRLINPTGIETAKGLVGTLLAVAGFVGMAAMVLAIVSLVLRFRRADGQEREQLKWLAFVAVGTLILLVVLATSGLYLSDSSPVSTILWVVTMAFGLLGIPASVSIAVLKYRLYDIDVVINKTLVYGSLAGFITAVYVGIVVGVGAALGRGASKPNLGLSILATAVVAVVFQPVRSRVQRVANRLVYGVRATPYDVLAGFVRQVGGTYASEDVLPRMARALAEGAGAASATVWLKVGSHLKPEASWPPEDVRGSAPQPMRNGDLPPFDGISLALPVLHRGETLGALTVMRPPDDPLTTTERRLAEGLAGQAGLVLRNVGLTEQLVARVEDIEASRSRIVTAEDVERRRLERRIEEGTWRDLGSTASAVDDAVEALRSDPERAMRALVSVGEYASRALDNLREVARGVYPPLLADKGLVAALEAQARRSTVPLAIHADGIQRFPGDVEPTVYFSCLEALENVARHAEASRIQIELTAVGDGVTFSVSDDGLGFDASSTPLGSGLQAVSDRVAAMGGDLEIVSRSGEGTTVRGHVPVGLLIDPAEGGPT